MASYTFEGLIFYIMDPNTVGFLKKYKLFNSSLYLTAIRNNDMKDFHNLYVSKCSLDPKILFCAMRSKQDEFIEYCIANKFPFDYVTAWQASTSSNKKVIDYIKLNSNDPKIIRIIQNYYIEQ